MSEIIRSLALFVVAGLAELSMPQAASAPA
jgi:hypothetical protein